MKVLNIIYYSFYIVSTAVQYNDPDPYIWMPLYLYCAFVCYQAFHKRYNPVVYIAGFILYLAYALYLLFSDAGMLNWATKHDAENIAQSMKATKPWIEETREFFG
ncbi:MAG TPA: transmembrane 220 family protein [Chitinophagaceae bacterium]|jgi:hypothetical protein|nr:transmembrane 220 family protein [Chitinophagaceae bacterium]